MAFPVIPEEMLEKFQPKPGVGEKTTEVIREVVVKSGKAITGLSETLLLLVIASWYFFFTGLALLFGKKLPKQWMDIATHISKEKLPRVIQNKPEETVSKPITKYKIVDLDTNQPLKKMLLNEI